MIMYRAEHFFCEFSEFYQKKVHLLSPGQLFKIIFLTNQTSIIVKTVILPTLIKQYSLMFYL